MAKKFEEWDSILRYLIGYFGDVGHANLWLHTPLKHFDGRTPSEVIADGQVDLVLNHIRDSVIGVSSIVQDLD